MGALGFRRDAFSVVPVWAGPWSKSAFNVFIDWPKPADRIYPGKFLITFVHRLCFGSTCGTWRMNRLLKRATGVNNFPAKCLNGFVFLSINGVSDESH